MFRKNLRCQNTRVMAVSDQAYGGSLDGVIQFCIDTFKIIDKDTVVIPGHGPITDYEKPQGSIQMLTTISTRMVKLIDEGASREEVYDAGVKKGLSYG